MNVTKSEFLSKNLTSTLDEFDYFSLDIFDTLIVRSCQSPAEIFDFIDASVLPKFQLQGFRDLRIAAENQARSNARMLGNSEISLDEIYNVLEQKSNLSKTQSDNLKKSEIEVELACSSLSDFGSDVLDYLNQHKKRFILSSDMYLPMEVITQLLEKSGVKGFEKILLSSETGKTKHDGEMFDDVIHHFDVDPSKILHIGDNFRADYLRAIENGLTAVHQPALRIVFDGPEIWNSTSLFRGKSIFKKMVNSQFVEKFSKDQDIASYLNSDSGKYWHAFGWLVVAPMVLGLVIWLEEQIKREGTEKIAFLARDGQFVKRAFETAFPKSNLQTTYMAASRRLITIPNKVLSPKEIHDFYSYLIDDSITSAELLNQIPGGKALLVRLETLGFDLSQSAKENSKKLFTAIGENSGLLTQALSGEREVLIKYINSEFEEYKKVALFDVGWRGSLQATIESLIPNLRNRLTGLYFGTNEKAPSFLSDNGSNYKSFSMSDGQPAWVAKSCQLNTDVIEFIFSADHGTVTGLTSTNNGFDWTVAKVSENEKKTQAIAAIIQNSALDSIQNIRKIMTTDDLAKVLDKDQICSDFYCFLDHPTKRDSLNFANVNVFSGVGDSEGESLTGRTKGRNLLGDFRKSRWKAGFISALGRTDQRVIRIVMKIYSGSGLLRRIWRFVRS